MPIIKGLEWTFDTAAQQYEKMRPEYVPELYQYGWFAKRAKTLPLFSISNTWGYPISSGTRTYSGHMVIEEQTRKAFFSEIEQAINRFGGEITIYDTIDLQRKQNK